MKVEFSYQKSVSTYKLFCFLHTTQFSIPHWKPIIIYFKIELIIFIFQYYSEKLSFMQKWRTVYIPSKCWFWSFSNIDGGQTWNIQRIDWIFNFCLWTLALSGLSRFSTRVDCPVKWLPTFTFSKKYVIFVTFLDRKSLFTSIFECYEMTIQKIEYYDRRKVPS